MLTESFQASLNRQLSITFALIVREMTTRYGNKFGGYAWAVLDPVLFVTMLTLIFSAIAHVPPLGRSFPLFFATGYATFYIYRSIMEQVSLSVRVNLPLLTYPIVKPVDTIVARLTLQVITLFLVNLILFGFLFMVTDVDRVNWNPILLGSAIAVMLGAGVGIANVVWFNLSSTYEQVWGIINRPAFIVSGVFFLPESIPIPFREVLLWNPLVHIIGLVRTGFYPTYRATYIDLPYVVGLALFSLVFGLTLVWFFDAKLREPK
jgi:capsular polysaccharide transport system permease protein